MANRKMRVVAALLAAIMASSPAVHAGDLNSEMNAMFNSMGATGTYTQPGAFRGQAMNTYTGGSIDMRIPNKRYQLFAFEKPSLHVGCNGVSINGGSMSLISGDEFVQLLKQFGSAMKGMAFQLALQAVSPILGGRVEWLKELESKLSISSKSSCELAGMAWSKIGDMANYSVGKACVDAAKILDGLGPAEAEKKCASAGGTSETLNRAKTSGDAELAKLPPFSGNLTWQALKRGDSAQLSDDDRELVMSMVGTFIYNDEGGVEESHQATLTSASQILKGEDAEDASGEVAITLLRCDETVACLHPTSKQIRLKSLTRRVRERMESIVQHIRNKQAFGTNSEEIAFVNMVNEPVYRMLSIATMTSKDDPAMGLIGRYGDVIAADYAYGLLSRTLRLGLSALMVQSKLNEAQARDATNLASATQGMLQTLSQEKTTMYSKVTGIASLTGELERLQRELRANSSSKILSMFGDSRYGSAN